MAINQNSWKFRPRYVIKGFLHTESPLFTGSGLVVPHPEIKRDDGPVEVMAFPRAGDTPYIPGSTIKGALRDWAHVHLQDRTILEKVFGKGSSEEQQGSGGRARFMDALLALKRTEPTPLPYWDLKRQTCVEAHVCIERVTGTAAEKMLYYQETVPAGVGFKVEIRGKADEGSLYQEVAFILSALKGFNHHQDPILLGADTQSAKGKMYWECEDILFLDIDALKEWLKRPCPLQDAYRNAHLEELHHLESLSKSIETTLPDRPLTVSVTITFDSHFLVNDPPRPRELQEKERNPESDLPDMKSLLDEKGQPSLPGSAIKGALRSQAERILRTLFEDDDHNRAACHPGQEDACKPIQDISGYERLCLACRMFGGPGWKSPLNISRFKCIDPGRETTQEFLAIDRFTGGGAHGAKFNIRAFYRPKFQGTISLDIKRMKKTEKEPSWALGLLGLLLRDLKEGDITFGLGSSKGYGTCTASIGCWDNANFQEEVRNGLESLRKEANKTRRP